jgi:hypothetical protein
VLLLRSRSLLFLAAISAGLIGAWRPLRAQTTTPFTARVTVQKSFTLRQVSATRTESGGSLLVVTASFPIANLPPESNIELRGPAGSLSLNREGPATYQAIRPFDDATALEAAFPDAKYTLVSSKGTLDVTVRSNAAVIEARAANFEELQAWDGQAEVALKIALPTGPDDVTGTVEIARQSTVIAGGQFVVVPPFSIITARRRPVAYSYIDPGEVLNATIILTTQRNGGDSTTGLAALFSRTLTLTFPVTRAQLPPQITTGPESRSVTAGGPVSFSVAATGVALSYAWRKDSVTLPGATNATLTLPSVQPSDAGSYVAVVTNTGGTVFSAAAQLTVVVPPSVAVPPVITVAPVGATLVAGGSHTFTVTASGTAPLAYQWLRDGTPLAGATTSFLAIDPARVSAGADYTVTITNAQGSVTSRAATLAVTPVSRLANLSIRTRVGGANGALTLGLTVGGGTAAEGKPLLIRAVGPTLAVFGVDGALVDPDLAVLSGANVIAQNDDWAGSLAVLNTARAVGAFALPIATSKDAALVPAPAAGGYTVRIGAANNGTGVALAEIYDATAPDDYLASTPRLTNISALSQVGTGGDILIAGFSVAGTTPKRLLVRAVGPTLTGFGVSGALADPRIELYASGATTATAANDNWSDSAESAAIAAAAASVGAFVLPAGSRDSVLLLTMAPGSYTIQVSGASATTGTALVEVYELP